MRNETTHTPTTARGETATIGAWDNPLDVIAEDHMREREVCAMIDKLVDAASLHGADRHHVLAFLEKTLPQHLADEEIDLFPLMLERCEPEDEIEAMIEKLHADHRHALGDAGAIIAILSADAAAASHALSAPDCRQLAQFAHHSRRHLIVENAIILPIARARLTDADLAAMKQRMLARRGMSGASETSP